MLVKGIESGRRGLSCGHIVTVSVEIPDELADRLNGAGGDLSRRALEALALEEYRIGRLSETELQTLLGFGTRYRLDGFLKDHDVWIEYTLDDFRREVSALEQAGV